MFICFFGSYCVSQTAFPKAPEDFKEIHFIYERKANATFTDRGLFADTLLLKLHFPDVKFKKQPNPKDTTQIYGFVPVERFSIGDQKMLRSMIYHLNEKYDGYYDREKNKTVIYAVRYDKEMEKAFRKHFRSSEYGVFKYKIHIDYAKQTVLTDYPMASYDRNFSEIQSQIKFTDAEKLYGFFEEKTKAYLLNNLVLIDRNLNDKITLGKIFENNEFGVHKIITADSTTELKSVTYK